MLKLASPVVATVVVAIAYLGWAGWYTHYHRVDTLEHVSSFFQQRADTSAGIERLTPTAAGNTIGYDGQFYAFIAADPIGARPYLDNPAYRYSRPVYPLLAGLAAGWDPGVIPWTLLVLGILGVAAATYALATVAGSRGISPWYGALAGAYPGLFLAVSNDLAEALAYGFLCFGLMAWMVGPRRLVASSLLFGIAGATRETTLIFPLVLACWLAYRERRVREAVQVACFSLAPYLLIKLGLFLWLGSWGYARATQLTHAPFLGLIRQWPWNDFHVQELIAVVAPALLAVFVMWHATRRATAELWLLIMNVFVLVVFLPSPSYVGYLASGRIATGVIIAFALCLPLMLERGKVAQAWLPIVLWMLPWYAVLPAALKH